jgi:hypothetical protein
VFNSEPMLGGATSKVVHGTEGFKSSFESIDGKSVCKIYSDRGTKSVMSHIHISYTSDLPPIAWILTW